MKLLIKWHIAMIESNQNLIGFLHLPGRKLSEPLLLELEPGPVHSSLLSLVFLAWLCY